MIVKKYIKGGLNSDVNPSLVPDGDYLNALNIRAQIGDDGNSGVIRPVPGHTKLITVADDRAGAQATSFTQNVKHICVDDVNGYAYAFVSGYVIDSTGPVGEDPIIVYPKIVRIDLKSDPVTSVDVLVSSNIDNKWEPGGDDSYLWNNLVEAKIIGDTLIWINNVGNQFSFNVNAYLNQNIGEPKFLSTEVDRRDISLIKAPPAFCLDVQKLEDTNYNGVNYIKDSVFQFAYRYIYAGYEQSVVSAWSREVPLNIEGDEFNYIKISIPGNEKIPDSILYVDIISKNNITGAINLIKRFSALDQNIIQIINNHNNDTAPISYNFYNDNIYEAVDPAYFIKQFDSVPISSYSIEVAKDRLFLANNVEGYDAPEYVDISINSSSTEPSDTREIGYSFQTFNNLNIFNDQDDIVDEYYYWRNIIYVSDVDNPGYYFANGDIDGTGASTVSDNGISLGNVNSNYPYVCEINTNPGIIDFTDLYLSNGFEIYIKGFANEENNGIYVVEEVLSSSALLVVKSDGVLPIEEPSGETVSITLLSSMYSRNSGDFSLIPTPVDDLYSELVYIPNQYYPLTLSYFIHRDFDLYPIAAYSTWDSSTLTPSGNSVSIEGLPTSQTRSFKSSSRYNIGVQYYDFAMRKCGVVTKTRNQELELIDMTASTPDRTYSSNLQRFITWGLQAGINVEIPGWAKYYSIVRTDNLDTRYFIQGKTVNIGTGSQLSYVDKDASTGAYVISATNLTYDSSVVGISIDLEPILNDGFGYIYEEANGDIVKLYKDSGETYTLKVIGQQGRYLIMEPSDLDALASNDLWIYEIRRPYRQTGSEPFYEGTIYEINNWGTSTRSYSVTTGSLNGDIFLSSDLEYMNLRKDFRNVWSRNLGRACFIDPIGQVYKPNGIRWSNTFVPDSQINGLSTFDAIDYRDAPVELGPINKLKTTSKAQSEGNVMLAIGQNYTASMYLGETSLIDNSGQSLLTTSGAVIGTINVLRGRFGTTIPSSVVEYDGNVYWADILNECVVRYSANGLFAISDYGMRNFFRSYFKLKKEYVNQYDIKQSPYIYGGYNPATDEYILSFEPCSNVYPDEYPDGSEVRLSDPKMMYKLYEIPPFSGEGYDTTGKSIGFSVSQERWTSFYSHVGPYFYFGGKMYSFVRTYYPFTYQTGSLEYISGGIFIFDKDSLINKFAEQDKDSFISIPANEAPSNIKIFQALSIEGDTAPTTTYVETFTPNNQVTNMISSDYSNREDMLYVEILRDRISPNVTGSSNEKMYKGDKLRGQYANISMMWENGINFEVRFINVNVKDSIGHNKLSQ